LGGARGARSAEQETSSGRARVSLVLRLVVGAGADLDVIDIRGLTAVSAAAMGDPRQPSGAVPNLAAIERPSRGVCHQCSYAVAFAAFEVCGR